MRVACNIVTGTGVKALRSFGERQGWDMSKWETEDHFVSWLRLCPDNRISGDRIMGKGRLPTNNRVSTALKMAASALRTSKTSHGQKTRPGRCPAPKLIALLTLMINQAREVSCQRRFPASLIYVLKYMC